MNWTTAWDILNFLIGLIGWIGAFLILVGGILTILAFLRGIALPMWRLGIGLARREIVLVGNTTGCDSLRTLLNTSKLFKKKNIFSVSSNKDLADIGKTNVILFYLEDSSITLEEVLDSKKEEGALVVYAKPGAITPQQWVLLDKHRNVSVCNLRGRLMGDLLTLMMTTGYEK